MTFIADFHIHSRFSLATSKELNPANLDYWAKIKGISLVGTGDFTHPKWLNELTEQLESSSPGLYRLKKQFILQNPIISQNNDVNFIVTSEISCIYKKNNKVRKVHCVIFAPSFEIAQKLQNEMLKHKFNINSDGRPIIGMDAKNLLEMCLNISEDILFVPAHIWTPWFSVLGAKSGFDNIKECFEDLTDYIFAVETGLSSDVPMNKTCSFLDSYVLLSNSDAHSPDKLGRNANRFNTGLDYYSIIKAIKNKDKKALLGTIDLFPQEGKYHYAGHRKCKVCLNPLETLKNNEICPVCGKKVTLGVMDRVMQLADRFNLSEKDIDLPFSYIIPLPEILAEILNSSPNSKKVQTQYFQLIKNFGNEFNILLNFSVDEISKNADTLITEAVRRMRNREIIIKEGYDGEYGIIKVFDDGEIEKFLSRKILYTSDSQKNVIRKQRQLFDFDIIEFKKLKENYKVNNEIQQVNESDEKYPYGLTRQQYEAICHSDGPSLIIAGPGTGKTRTLAYKVSHLIDEKNINPENILVITFTNKACDEIKDRLSSILGNETSNNINIYTFHGFGYKIINENIDITGRKKNFSIISETEKTEILKSLNIPYQNITKIVNSLSEFKQKILHVENINLTDFKGENNFINELVGNYDDELLNINAFDLDDLLRIPVLLFKNHESLLDKNQQKYKYVLVDEYQDVNEAQYYLLMLLVAKNRNITAIGDPNQSIYGFRGANVTFIQRFKDDFPDAAIFNLTQSFRCTNKILKASQNIVKTKISGFQFSLSGISEGVKINISQQPTDKSEAEFIARTIENMIGGTRFFSIDSNLAHGHEEFNIKGFSDFAVLARTKYQLKTIAKAFNDHAIPYRLIGENELLNSKFVNKLIYILKAFLKKEIFFKSEKHDLSIDLKNIPDLPLNELIVFITEKYLNSYKEEEPDIYQLIISKAKDYNNDINGFLNSLILGTEADLYDYNTEFVPLMTLHASKGLEFQCVFIAGCEDGLIPYNIFSNYNFNEEEEKRLLYVGMTRAKNYLYLTYANKRFYRNIELSLTRSRFLDKIEKDLYKIEKQKAKVTKKTDGIQLKLFD
jgi:uncharacterized protein (TIGR00375 family)